MGCEVDVVAVYRTTPADPDPAVIDRLRHGSIDVLTLTSGAMAKAFLDAIVSAGLDPHAMMEGMLVATIGPITSEALRKLGYDEDIQAVDSTMDSLVAAVVEAYEAPNSANAVPAS